MSGISGPRFRRAEGVHSREIAGEAFLIPPEGGDIFALDGSGAAVWRLLADTPRLAEMTDAFADAFPDQPRDRLEADLAALLAELLREGLAVQEQEG